MHFSQSYYMQGVLTTIMHDVCLIKCLKKYCVMWNVVLNGLLIIVMLRICFWKS
jgi:hypothetical protein